MGSVNLSSRGWPTVYSLPYSTVAHFTFSNFEQQKTRIIFGSGTPKSAQLTCSPLWCLRAINPYPALTGGYRLKNRVWRRVAPLLPILIPIPSRCFANPPNRCFTNPTEGTKTKLHVLWTCHYLAPMRDMGRSCANLSLTLPTAKPKWLVALDWFPVYQSFTGFRDRTRRRSYSLLTFT